MEDNKENDDNSYINIFFGDIAIILIVLKLCGVLNAPWWVILLPIEIPIAMIVLLMTFVVFVILVAVVVSWLFDDDKK